MKLKPNENGELDLKVFVHTPHPKQKEIRDSKAKRKVVRAGRRGGKTDYAAQDDTWAFLGGRRVLYGAPTIEQVGKYWKQICMSLDPLIEAGILKKNESEKYIELTKFGIEIWKKKYGFKLEKLKNMRIKAKTCFDPQTLRGDYADKLTLDEWQNMAEDTWDDVGEPMLFDNNGDVTFIYTPPSMFASGITHARDPRHASKMYRKAVANIFRFCPKCEDFVEPLDDLICPDCKTLTTFKRWEAFHFTSYDNPHISQAAIKEASINMSPDSFRREIMAEDDEIEQSWLVYGAFNEACIKPRFDIPVNWLVYSGHDFGSSNPAALFLAQDPSTGNFYIFNDYTPGSGKSAPEHVEAFRHITEGYKVIKSVGGNLNTEDDARQLYTQHGWPILSPKYGKVNAQIDRVIGLMRLNKLFIFDDLLGLREELANCLWDLDADGKVTNKIHNEARYHRLACLRYIGSDFTPETAMSGKPNQSSSMGRKYGSRLLTRT